MTTRPIGLAPGASEEAAGQDAAKYATRNPVVLRLIGRWLRVLREVIGPVEGTVVDVGTGEGLALERILPAGRPAVAVEYRLDKLQAATARLEGITGLVADAGMLPLRSSCGDLVTCIEVLEHLVRPDQAVAELARITRGACVVSVPWEPWFRGGNLARFKDVGRLGNNPEHVQQFTPRRLAQTLDRSFATVEVVRCFPWLVARAQAPRRP